MNISYYPDFVIKFIKKTPGNLFKSKQEDSEQEARIDFYIDLVLKADFIAYIVTSIDDEYVILNIYKFIIYTLKYIITIIIGIFIINIAVTSTRKLM